MNLFSTFLKSAMIAVLMIFFTGCEKEELNEQLFEAEASVNSKAPNAKAEAEEEAAGNNLSFPVIWAEGIDKDLRERPADWVEGYYLLTGEWWFVWGPEPVDPDSPIYSCAPSPSDELLCLDQTEPGTEEGLYKGWVQKDAGNFWEAYNDFATLPVNVDFIDWGDNLESIDWNIKSRVRTELVLYENVVDQGETVPVLQYPMRHVDGWGITEVHGLQTDLEDNIQFDNVTGDQATVYSERTRMTIQKLNVDPENLSEGDLTWDAGTSEWVDHGSGESLINPSILNQSLAEAEDGPGYFNAEVNVKGKIIYGYTWDMKKMNEGTGFYRITYSFDADDGLNTFITNSTTIIVAEEEEDEGHEDEVNATEDAEAGRGGEGMVDFVNNLTYMDIEIVGKTTGGGGGNSGGGNGGGGNNGGGNSGGGHGSGH
ncbi:hypothetical protein [Salegentibacter flavus]|uniref:Uncharacterized protein n=1 Tax=Salegentibacter flavus TaxID=287099 RepID=A0A1I5D083_9FLAO|nr:hypothetical protein [Salegentibacter flavus]SFN92660.1 hypothetical protein SAMN05660413_03103 [Salegentibacter flavus]